ncbi:MAG: hypothetical protein GY792_35350 [Gammaproteobacteria bacterium]|nr:hypothetical protein [Gammaproteobacteria bacterium]
MQATSQSVPIRELPIGSVFRSEPALHDDELHARLAEIRENNGGKPPNIIYILLDDMGFGEIGMPELSVIRGYKTPHIDAFANEGLSLMRM